MKFIFFTIAPVAMASALALGACSKETIVTQAQPGDDAGVPAEDAGAGPATTADASPPPDRSVKGSWEKVPVHPPDGDPLQKLSSIFVRGPSDVYASEGSSNLGTGFYHYDGKGWTGVRYSGYAATLVGLPSGELLGYGADLFIKTKTGDAWERLPQPQGPGAPAFVASLWGSSISDIYASSSSGNMRFDGDTWSLVSALTTNQGEFSGVAAKDIWYAASNGKYELSHYDGSSWTNHWDTLPEEVKKAPTGGPYGVFASAADNVWAMGRQRTVIHYDGAAWRVVPGPNDEWGCDLTRGWASSKKNAWLVGKGGCVFHWDGAAWEKVPSGVTDDIFGIHGSDAEHVWIAPSSTTTVLRLKPE